MTNKIDNLTNILFNQTFGIESDNLRKVHRNQAKQQIAEFGWENTFTSWKNFLFKECKTPESVINFANLFWSYGGEEYPIPEPYKFIAYFYYRVDFKPEIYDGVDILDSLVLAILPKAGYSYADWAINWDYYPEKDPKMVAEVNEFKSLNR